MTMCHPFRPLLALLFALPLCAWGEERSLDEMLQGLQSMRGDFKQVLIDQGREVLERASGEMWIKRPGRFRLEYTAPYEQLYVADGEKVWMYDKDLEQVTVRPLDDALGTTPALLLTGSEPLSQRFVVTDEGRTEGLHWFELRPKQGDGAFDHLVLGLTDAETIEVMEMVDSFGQTTRLSFSQVERNVELPDAAFHFTPPAGVDVVGGGE